MNPFDYTRSDSVRSAVDAASVEGARIIAGGTNLVDLMKMKVERPRRLVDITQLPLDTIEETEAGGLRLGALVTNADTAWHPAVEARYPLLSKAILAGASPQLRNKATDGGNLMQRTRCYYFYDADQPCNKREPGSGCPAIGGYNRIHAILGASEHCIATHPSDMCVALAALDAVIHIEGPGGARSLPIADFHRLPGDTPHIDHTLRAGEVVVAIELPPQGFAAHHAYIKVRDRQSYAFALVSVAVGLVIDDGVVTTARVALGGVAHKPWRDRAAEALIEGKAPRDEHFRAAAHAIVRGAKGYGHNDFKITLVPRVVEHALQTAAKGGA